MILSAGRQSVNASWTARMHEGEDAGQVLIALKGIESAL